MYNFDEIINRKHTNCFKWDSLIEKYGEDNNIIPMGIADMDFLCCPAISQAIKDKLDQQVYGYGFNTLNQLGPIICERYNKRGYNIQQEDIVLATGVVYAVTNAVLQFTNPNDKIVLPAPYYTPFEDIILSNERVILECPMVERNNRLELDLKAIEDQMNESVKAFILCNPHNPTGRIYDHQELVEIAEFCQKHKLLIIADEIHADFAFKKPFESILNINDYTRNNTVVFLSATKTFNLAGLKISFGFIPNKEKREQFTKRNHSTGLDAVNILAVEAMKTAYTKCTDWEEELIAYLKGNCEFVYDFITKNIPTIKLYPNEGTYLIWLDMRECKIDPEKLSSYLLEEVKVGLNDGTHYGKQFAGFARMNVACPRPLLQEALTRLANAFNK